MGFVMSKVFHRPRKMTPDRWIREATAEQVTAGFMNLILDGDWGYLSKTYTEQQLLYYRQNFDSMSISKPRIEPYVDHAAFGSFLTQHFQSIYPTFVYVAPILYQIALTHAAYPFSADPPNTLSADSLLRAITLLTGRAQPILRAPFMVGSDTYFLSPERSERDIRRLIFQSLAVPVSYVKFDKKKRCADLTDDDLADVHMVACRAQSRPDHTILPRQWSELLPMATRLSEPLVPLEDLRIPYETLRHLLKPLLAVQSVNQPLSGTKDVAVLDSQAVALLLAAGCEGGDVSFEAFETVYEGLGRREGRFENELVDELFVPLRPYNPQCGIDLKPDLLQCLAKIFEVFLAPQSEELIKS